MIVFLSLAKDKCFNFIFSMNCKHTISTTTAPLDYWPSVLKYILMKEA